MGTDDNSSKSKSTLNLNLFFFIRINDMMWDCAAQVSGWNCGGGRQPNTFSELSLLLTQLSLLCRHDSKFKSLPSHPLKHNINDAREIPRCDWTARLMGKKKKCRQPEFNVCRWVLVQLLQCGWNSLGQHQQHLLWGVSTDHKRQNRRWHVTKGGNAKQDGLKLSCPQLALLKCKRC